MKNYLCCAVVISVLGLGGCGGHKPTAKELVPKIESYKASLGTMTECVKQVEGARELFTDVEKAYTSRAFKKYLESAQKEIDRADIVCDKYDRFKGEATTPKESLEKMSTSVVDAIKSALTVVENGINQQEAYKAAEQH